ncbi:MAG: hypothetical protein HY817_02325 [Candidatus Abawacabacteria bacterium]|nr:hypothetical protein [Candidatus Abawacabacteria bacterium]
MNSHEVVAQIKALSLAFGQYILVGGGVLAIHHIRETKDIDIVVVPALFEQLAMTWPLDQEYERKWQRKRLKKGEVEIYPDLYLEKQSLFINVAILIKQADMVEDLPLQPLEHLMMCKLDSAREKDLQDVELIKKYLERVAA